jgi:hypothetical protein
MGDTSWARELSTGTSTTTAASLTIGNVKLDGTSNIGHVDDTDLMTLASGTLTVNGTVATNVINATSGDLTITAAGGDISFGNENLTTTGWMGIGIASRTSSGMGGSGNQKLEIHGSAPSLILTSTDANEGGQINIQGTSGGGGTDYKDYGFIFDMYQKEFRLLYDAEGANTSSQYYYTLVPSGADGDNCNIVTATLRHGGDGSVVVKGTTSNPTATRDRLTIGGGGDYDQQLVFNNSGTDRYIAIDADQSDSFRIGTASTIGSNISMEIDTSHNVKFHGQFSCNGQTPAAAPNYTVSNLSTDRALDCDSTSDAEVADVLGQVITDLIAVGIFQ